MRTIKTWLATIAALLCSITANAYDFEVDSIYYNITSSEDMTVEVTYVGGYEGDINIPSTTTFDGKTYNTTSIGSLAFAYCSSLTAINIPESVTEIGYSAFFYCNSLTAINIPEGVTSIGDEAFYNCNSLTAINIPESVTEIGYRAFFGCYFLRDSFVNNSACYSNDNWGATIVDEEHDGLLIADNVVIGCRGYVTDAVIPDGIIGIGDNAFRGCYNNLISVTIPESVTEIGYRAFFGCNSLTAINIPEGVTSIGNEAFNNCSSLTSITIPEGVTSIGSCAFYDCSNLTGITIPESVTSIGSCAFYDCSNLTAINIPEGVTSIGNEAFYNCSSLTSITIPESVTSIGSCAFYDCSNLTGITIPESVTSIGEGAFNGCYFLRDSFVNNSACYSNDNWGATIVDEERDGLLIADNFVVGCKKYVTDAVIPDGIIGIGDNAFIRCYNLISVTIPESVTEIGEGAFYNCNSLTAINIPESVTSIGERAFYYCNSLTAINIPEGVTSIGNDAFYECTSLKEVIIEDGSTALSLGYNYYYSSGTQGLFYDCPLETVYLGRNLSYSSGQSYGYSPFYNRTKLTSVTVGDSVTSIGSYAFYNCSSLTSITIPEGVTSIGNSAFRHCSSLTSITIPESVTEIGEGAFYYCSSLTAINIPEGVTSIGNSAFRNCSSLTSITIPESVTSIGEGAFSGCSSLTAINLPESVTEIGEGAFTYCSSLTAINIPEGVTSIGNSAFRNCSSLTSITIPESVTSIGEGAFSGCSSLTAINLPEGLTTIEGSVFEGCTSLYSVTLPSTIETIGVDAFRNSCVELTCLATVPPYVEREDYSSNLGSVQKVYVPAGSMNSYKSTEPWSDLSVCPIYGAPIIIHVATPGTMGEEILKHIDYLRNVIDLTITGVLGEIDIENIRQSMPDLVKIDLSGVDMAEIPEAMFSGKQYLSTVVLPENLESIGEQAFSYCAMLSDITIPEGVKSIGDEAFRSCTSLRSISLPNSLERIGHRCFYGCNSLRDVTFSDNLTEMGSYCFSYCYSLQKVTLPARLTNIPSDAFCCCYSLQEVILPEKLESISSYAFGHCNSLLRIEFPESLKSIGDYAFNDCESLISVAIPEGCTYIASDAFAYCNNLTEVTLPSSLYVYNNIFNHCPIEKTTCMALIPPVLSSSLNSNGVLYVPALALNKYKQTPGWASFREILPIEGAYPPTVYVVDEQALTFSSEEIPAEYNPDMYVGFYGYETPVLGDGFYYEEFKRSRHGSLHLKGEATWALNRYCMTYVPKIVGGYWEDDGYYEWIEGLLTTSSLINEANVTADTVIAEVYTEANEWTFLSFPYDVKVSDILTEGGDWVIRRYDGQARAEADYNHAWATVPYDGVLEAGQGYIWSGTDGYFGVVAMDNENKNRIFTNDTAYTTLEEHAADRTTDANWNLIGNPFPSYYDTRFMEYSAPITVWDSENHTYAAYSPVDDSYVLMPFEAFFVQKPTGVLSIAFAPEGRQTDYTVRNIETRAKARAGESDARQVINLTLGNSKYTDRTRVVLNSQAHKEYEAVHDAPKFMSSSAEVPQLFSIEEGESMAINERPMSDGYVALGVHIGERGSYTLAMDDTAAQKVTLTDHKTGIKTDLTSSDYTFTSDAGDYHDRFSLKIGEATDITAIVGDNVKVETAEGVITVSAPADVEVEVFNATGAKVAAAYGQAMTFDVEHGVYIVKIDSVSYKVSVK